MSDRVALQPMSMGALAIHDKKPRQDAERHFARPARRPAQAAARASDGAQDRDTGLSAPIPYEEAALPAETLFAAALLANDLALVLPAPELRRSDAWEAPDSSLRLRDRTI